MRMKNFKKTILIIMFLTLCLTFTGRAVYAADKVCTTYKNYYLMLMPTQQTPTALQSLNQTGQAFFEPIDTTAEVSYGQVCVSHTKRHTCSASEETISAATFYEKMNIALSKDPVGEKHYKNDDYAFYATEPEQSGSTVVQYFAHLKWRDVTNNGTAVGNGVNVVTTGNGHNGASKTEFVDAMFFPTTNVSKTIESNALIWNITRIADDNMFPDNNNTKATPFKYDWPGGEEEEKDTYVAPAVGLATYTVCTEEEGGGNGEGEKGKLYTATIKYLNKANNKAVLPEYKKEFYDGEGEVVSSKTPTDDGCVTTEKSVTVKIEGENFNKTVWYTCNVSSGEEPKTGTAMFVICMIIGFSCLAYFLYYAFVGRKKANNDV